MKKLLAGCAIVALLAGCNVTNQQSGTLLGAGAGGLLGSQIGSGSGRLLATGIGVLLGAAAGNAVGQNIDRPRTTVIYRNGAPLGPCSNITNAGVRSSCQRGLADRRAQEQRAAERQAYQCSRYGRCN